MGIKYFCLVLSLSLGFVQTKADNAIEEPVNNDDFDECLEIKCAVVLAQTMSRI